MSENQTQTSNVVSQGWQVAFLGVVGPILGLLPFVLATMGILPKHNSWVNGSILLWGIVVGSFVSNLWTNAIHTRVAKWAAILGHQEEAHQRLPWMPGWIGALERLVYIVLLSSNVQNGATFIGVWVALKLAAGWQPINSKGGPIARATVAAGLLGNIMSVLFGVAAGAALRALLDVP